MQQLLSYLQTNEFRNLVSGLEHIPQFVELLSYLQSAGLDAYYLMNQINDYLHLNRPIWLPCQRRNSRFPRSNRGYAASETSSVQGKATQFDGVHPVHTFLGISQKVVDIMCANTVLDNFLLKLKDYGVWL